MTGKIQNPCNVFWVGLGLGMINRRISILLACFGVILMASTATAGSTHHHDHKAVAAYGAPVSLHAHQAVSPFEVKLGDKRLHCELLGHSPLLPCPHHKVPAGEKDRCFLTSDCGGGPFPAPSLRSMGDQPRILVPVASADDDLLLSGSAFSTAVFYDPFFSHSLDRPPRAL